MEEKQKPVRVLRSCSNGVSFDKAFQLAKSDGLILVSNKRADQLLNGPNQEWKSVKEAWPIHTGTMTAFTEPRKKLGATVKYKDPSSGITWVFEVPTGVGLRSLRDVLLAVEHPNYDLEIQAAKKRIIVYPQKKLILPVTDFPAEDGWYATNPETAIPINQPLDSSDSNARMLWRIPTRVGSGVRGGSYYGRDERRGVFVGDGSRPSDSLGVLTLVDSREAADAEKSTEAASESE